MAVVLVHRDPHTGKTIHKGLSSDPRPTGVAIDSEYIIENTDGREYWDGDSWVATRKRGALITSEPYGYIDLIDDTTTPGYTYFGRAWSGTSAAAVAWEISRMENATGNTYPVSGGALAAWSNRASESYA